MADNLDLIEQLLAEQEKSVRDAFLTFIKSVRSDVVMAAIIERLQNRDTEGAMKIVDSYVAQMGAVIPQIAATVGTFTATELTSILAEDAPEIVTAVSFDPTHPRAAEIIRSHRFEFVERMRLEQRRSLEQALRRVVPAVSQSLEEGTHIRSAASAVRDSIGLNSIEEQWVASFREQLMTRDRRALGRDLRNRRHDGTIERAISRDRPLTPKQIDHMVDQYRRNTLQRRAEMIARTEGTMATSQARDEALDQMIEQTGIDPVRVVEKWNATRDKRTRAHHASMNGQLRPRGEPFVDGLGNRLRFPCDPLAPAVTRIHCRCAKTFSVAPAA